MKRRMATIVVYALAVLVGLGAASLLSFVLPARPAAAQQTKPVFVNTTAPAASLVICNGSCTVHSYAATSGASAGYLMTFYANAAPADGAVTPKDCWAMGANSPFAVDYGTKAVTVPAPGFILVFSTTGCYTLTKSNAQFLKGSKTG